MRSKTSILIAFFSFIFMNLAFSLESQKPVCTIYGNCQGLFIYDLLKKYFPETYKYNYISNWKSIEDPQNFSALQCQEADIFIYQPIEGYGQIDSEYIKNHLLKPSCITISFAYLYFKGYFPDYVKDENNLKTVSWNAPYGLFPYGQKKIQELINNGIPIDKIVKISKGKNFLKPEFIQNELNEGMRILRKKEEVTDIKLADFIEKNYSKIRLFHSVNHPSNFLLNELAKEVLFRMGLDFHEIENQFLNGDEYFHWTHPIIYPCVAKVLKLQFDTQQTTLAEIDNEQIKVNLVLYDYYIKKYFEILYSKERRN